MWKKQLKKKPISTTVNGKRLFKNYGNANEDQAQTVFGSIQHGRNDKKVASFRNSDEAIEHSISDMVHAMGSYEEKLGKSFQNLQKILATSEPDSVGDADAVGEYQSLSAVDSYEDKLGKSFRNLSKRLTRLNKISAMVAAAEAPHSPTSVGDALINVVDNSEKKAPKVKAMKFNMGAYLKNVKETVPSKVDAIKNKSTLKQETVEEEVAPKEKVRTPVATTSHVASFEKITCVDNEHTGCVEEDINMEPSMEVVQYNDRIDIGFYAPHKPEEDDDEGAFDLSTTVYDLSLMFDGAVAQTLTLGTQAMDQLSSFFSYADVDQKENIDLTTDTPQQNKDCLKDDILPLVDAPSEEEGSTDVTADNGELGQSSIDPSINSRLEQLEDPLEASSAANNNIIEASEQLSPAANDGTTDVAEQFSSGLTKQMISHADNGIYKNDTYSGLKIEFDDRNDCLEETSAMSSYSEEARQEIWEEVRQA